MKIGQGFDVHAFGDKNKPLIIGGVNIPYKHGLIAHSDGDVIFHAIIDALLGAAGLGDIGTLYPDNNQSFCGINSAFLLKNTYKKIKNRGYKIKNIDVTTILQSPKLFPYYLQIKKNINKYLEIKIENINVKSTSTEKLGFLGRAEGIACMAIVLIYKTK